MAFSLQSIEYPGTPAYSVSTFTALCRLSVVMGDILSGVYAERTFDKSPNELSKLLENLDSKLKAWKSSLPKHLEMDPEDVLKATPPHVFSLKYVNPGNVKARLIREVPCTTFCASCSTALLLQTAIFMATCEIFQSSPS